MNDREVIEILNDMKGVFGKRGHEQYSLYAIDRAISALEKTSDKGCNRCEYKYQCAIRENFSIDYCSDWEEEEWII